jgi:hypothetical protein
MALISAVISLAGVSGFGQGMFGGLQRNYGNEQLAKLFGPTEAFTAVADVSIQDRRHSSPVQMEMMYAFLKGKLRTEMDMAKMKGTEMPPEAMAQMKQMGMDRTITIYNSNTRAMWLVYPGLKACCEIVPPGARAVTNEAPKMEVTKLGKDTIDGHPCEKNKITIFDKNGVQHEIMAWQAIDMNQFPIKTEMTENGGAITTHFRDIKLSAPDASLFEPPSDFKRYGSMQELMMNSMQQMMQGMPSQHPMPSRGGMPPHAGGQNE